MTKLYRRVSLLLLIIWSCCLINNGQCQDTPTPPNVMLILVDDLGFSDLGCYGGEIETPNLDRLAENGLRFTQFYNTARCWPTRGAVMTGYYAQQIRRDGIDGKGGAQGKRPEWAKLLSEMLRPRGYRNYHSGKWHIDGNPLACGFDHSFEIGGGQNNFFKAGGNTVDGKPMPQTPDYYVTNATADHAVECLREHAEKFAAQPFFHYLCFTAPHFPLHALPEDIAKYRERYRRGWNEIQRERFGRIEKQLALKQNLPAMERDVGPPYHNAEAFKILGDGEVNRPLPWTELTDEQREFQATKMAIHAAMIDRMDQAIGRVIAQLKAMNAFENTLIFFASDNGASAEIMVRGDGHDRTAPPGSAATFLCLGPGWSSTANTPFRRHKTWVHEGGISTPLIAHWPRGIAAKGELRNSPGHMVDIVPTVLELAGAKQLAAEDNKPLPALPGMSLVPAFKSDVTIARDYLWWLHEGNRALRVGDWKIVSSKKNEWELYDLSTDRGETKDLAKTEPDRVRAMSEMWSARTEAFRALAWPDAPEEKNPPAKKKQ